MSEEPSLQNIARKGIRRLLDSVEDGDVAKDESLNFDYANSTFFEKVGISISNYVKKVNTKHQNGDFINFIFSLFSYISMRIRVVFVILGILGEIFSDFTENFKKVFVKNLFWGRGSIFRFSMQFIVLIVCLVFFVGYVYRSSSSIAGISVNSVLATDNSLSDRRDVLIQRGSSTTTSPKERGRIGFEKYTVKSGDTLFKISKQKDISVDTILWANPFIQNEIIRPGDVLSIPETDGVVVTAKKGDTVYTLAKKYKVSPQVIADKNYLEYPYELRAGEVVLIPGATPIEVPKPAAPKVVYSGVFKPKVSYTSGASSVTGTSRFLSWPVAGSDNAVSQCWNGYHNGLDVMSVGGTFPKIVAAAPGKVVFAGCQTGNCPPRGIGAWGGTGLAWTIAIDHGNGYSTIYAHLDDIYIGSGSTVSAGQVIGRMGRTGYATGTHIHFMVTRGPWNSWNDVNPAYYFKLSTAQSKLAGSCGY